MNISRTLRWCGCCLVVTMMMALTVSLAQAQSVPEHELRIAGFLPQPVANTAETATVAEYELRIAGYGLTGPQSAASVAAVEMAAGAQPRVYAASVPEHELRIAGYQLPVLEPAASVSVAGMAVDDQPGVYAVSVPEYEMRIAGYGPGSAERIASAVGSSTWHGE